MAGSHGRPPRRPAGRPADGVTPPGPGARATSMPRSRVDEQSCPSCGAGILPASSGARRGEHHKKCPSYSGTLARRLSTRTRATIPEVTSGGVLWTCLPAAPGREVASTASAATVASMATAASAARMARTRGRFEAKNGRTRLGRLAVDLEPIRMTLDLPIDLPGTRRSRKEIRDEPEGIVSGIGRTVGQDPAFAARASEHAPLRRRSSASRRPEMLERDSVRLADRLPVERAECHGHLSQQHRP